MNRLESLQRVQSLLARLVAEVKVANAGGHFDINRVAEDFFIPILAALFDCPDLKNNNRDQDNYPAIDLGSENRRISFQVTSDRSSSKIAQTLKKFREHNLHGLYDQVYVLIITERQESYSSSALLSEIQQLPISIFKYPNLFSFFKLEALD